MDLQSFSTLTPRQEVFVAWMRKLPDCKVILSVADGEPRSAKTQGAMVGDMTYRHCAIGGLSAAELAILGACQELGYGTIELTMAASLVQGWRIIEQSVVFAKTAVVDRYA